MTLAQQPVAPPRTLDLAGGLVPRIERMIAKASLHGDPKFYNTDDFAWTGRLEAAFPAIREECESVLAAKQAIPGFEEISHDQTKLTNDKRWQTYFLLGYGLPFADNIEACPRTWEALQNVPGLVTAFFSIMAPGKQIPTHRGPYKGVLRYHLGVKIPDHTEVDISVENETRCWREGGSLVFDDTFHHSARNLSDQPRVVLFVDFERPLKRPWSWLNKGILKMIARSGYVQEAKVNYDVWRKQTDALSAAS